MRAGGHPAARGAALALNPHLNLPGLHPAGGHGAAVRAGGYSAARGVALLRLMLCTALIAIVFSRSFLATVHQMQAHGAIFLPHRVQALTLPVSGLEQRCAALSCI